MSEQSISIRRRNGKEQKSNCDCYCTRCNTSYMSGGKCRCADIEYRSPKSAFDILIEYKVFLENGTYDSDVASVDKEDFSAVIERLYRYPKGQVTITWGTS